ncbi:MAG TPA: trehalose-phosphatase [Aeromicrobium sp.]|nr:trehalose-phosphatase [Aeromicrobium sp.]
MVELGRTLLALDFDGTLSPIVDNPASAFIHPGSLAALTRLGPALGALAIVTGRPVEQVRRLGHLDEAVGLERVVVCGQYGAERWDALTGELHLPNRPALIPELVAMLPDWLARHDARQVLIEDKGIAVALHGRGASDPALLASLADEIGELAARFGLQVEPGRQVTELRLPGSDKGMAVRWLVDRFDPQAVIYAGDDLGDLPAFRELLRLRAEGLDVTLVCSASPEQDALVPLSDVVLDGPDEVAAWLTALAEDHRHLNK